ncbi:HdeD family acid-resistance protein [Pararhodonellum marinum]|uniref:HdeD family acid-resistance protein n=1 Tax=Pararhodonellum marinum TaxID=2755358 RepID=UPI00188FF3CD|nr:HdeD family acid-resistance protein [Pararhodonellum marinum]
MPKEIIEKLQYKVKNWWLTLVLGILFILVGIWTMATPLSSFVSLSILFGVIMFVSGVTELTFSISNRKEIDNWGWHFAGAIVDFIIGAMLLFYPGLTMAVLPLMVAFYFMFKGFAGIGASMDIRRAGVAGWGWGLFFGIVSMLLGIMIVFNPMIGGLAIVYFTGMAFIVIGLIKIFISLQLRKVRHNVASVKETIKAKLASG